ncbi:disease resistance protein Pik-2-like [Typha angustifolia]|uniref:disease resistance protein Pik-2-like n=1 Tax=Typha angustifolia TaxID=59011 RepID=UPI003C2EE7D1
MELAVVSAAKGAVNTLLGKLASLLTQEAALLTGVRDEIQYIKDELESMNGFLSELSESDVPDHDKQVKIWMKQVREMAYDAEDCIDDFMHHLGKPCGHGLKGMLRRGSRLMRTLQTRHRIAAEIQSLKARALHASERHSRYGLAVGAATNRSTITTLAPSSGYSNFDPRLPFLFADNSQHVGIKKPVKEIVKLLKDKSVPQLRVISIVGFGGLGKTTLARRACQSRRVKSAYFKCQAFVAVSQTFETKNLLMDILKQVTKPAEKGLVEITGAEQHTRVVHSDLEGIETWGLKQLGSKLKEHLQDKRYVIVLDDIWNISAWESIKFALPDNSNNGSRIIVTTRIEGVAHTCCYRDHDHIYKIQPLSENESRKLFFKRVFGSDSCPDEELKEVSDDILKKCGGLPLAIVSIGGLLASKPYRTKQEWKKMYDRLGSELETSPTLEGMKKILTLSYNDLPYHLKACFLYLSIFPKDYEIERTMLQRRWVAEGFVSGRRGWSIEDVAESYFNEFISRSIIQPMCIGLSGKVRSFKVHDLMLEIILSKSIEENFVCLLQGEHYAMVPQDKVRRLSIHSRLSRENAWVMTTAGLSHVRSLTFSGSAESLSFASLDPLRVLRVLDLTSCWGLQKNQLKSICKLFQLKYLSLQKTYISMLPKEIGKLPNLETLDVRETYISKLPAGVVKLQHLKHLLCDFHNPLIPRGVGKMQALQKLYNVQLTSSTAVQELGELTQLIKLCIKINIKERRASNLLSLSLGRRSLTQKVLSLQPNGFPNLKFLEVENDDISFLEFKEGTMPKLEEFSWIRPLQREITQICGIEHLLKIKEIELTGAKTPSFQTMVDAVKAVAKSHPNHPRVKLVAWDEPCVSNSDQ